MSRITNGTYQLRNDAYLTAAIEPSDSIFEVIAFRGTVDLESVLPTIQIVIFLFIFLSLSLAICFLKSN
jgi:hypothetical protein